MQNNNPKNLLNLKPYAHGVHLAVCDMLHKNRSVTHIAGKITIDDQDREMYEEGFGIVTPTIASHKVPIFNLEIEKRKCAKW